MTMKCEHYDDCGNFAVYGLETVGDEKRIHVCEDCDKEYTNCAICGNSGRLSENMSIRWEEDGFPTCFPCQEKGEAAA